MLMLTCCEDAVCRSCLEKSVQMNNKHCPLCDHELNDLDLIAGTINLKEWADAEQERHWKQGDCKGLRCSAPECHGVIDFERRPDAQDPWKVFCPVQRCGAEYCGRCQNPWIEDHRCADLRAEDERLQREQHDQEQNRIRERRQERIREIEMIREIRREIEMEEDPERRLERRAELEREWERLRERERREIEWERHPEAERLTAERLAQQFQDGEHRECPLCGVMTFRTDGCNMMTCPNCRKDWCFACGRQNAGCTHFVCARHSSS